LPIAGKPITAHCSTVHRQELFFYSPSLIFILIRVIQRSQRVRTMRFIYLRRIGYYLSIVTLAALGWLSAVPAEFVEASEAAQSATDPVIAAAGDIACDPSSSSFNGGNGTSGACRQRYTSDMLVNGGFAAVLALGDIQYYCGGYQAWLQSYDLSWGRVKPITRPAVGNHEYLTSGGTDCNSANAGADGYFRYFGAAAGQKGQGYYSYNIGAWHLIALNSNCSSAGGCGTNSAQGLWLQQDLAANQNLCTLAYWHIPLFSSGGRANNNTQALWQILYNNNVELVLNGHDHIYERFAPQAPNGSPDTARGIRQFTVGTGGSNHTSLASIAANSLVRNTDTFGILKLTLHPSSYDWQFVPEAGKTFTDSGAASCFGSGQTIPTNAPSPTGEPVPTLTNTALSMTPQANSGPTTTFTFSPVADAYVNESSSTTNYGTSTQLRTDGSPIVRSYMRFDVRNLVGRITRATLRVYANSALSAGYDVRPVTNTTWGETTLNYGNAPTFGSAIGASGSVSAGSWTSVDLTSLITGNGVYNMVLTSANSTALSLASREATSMNQPQLIVETQIDPTATQTFTASPTFSLTLTPSQTAIASPTSTNTTTASATPPQTQTNTPTLTMSATALATSSQTNTASPTTSDSVTDTPTATQTATDTPVPTVTPTIAEIASFTPTATDSAGETPVSTDTGTPPHSDPPTDTPVPLDTATHSPTDTSTPPDTDTPPATYTVTFTDLPAPTHTATQTATDTALPTPSETKSSTATPTNIPIPTSTATRTPTFTPVPSATPSRTSTVTPTRTSTATAGIRTFTFTPAADSYVDQSNPTTNYGTSTQVRVDGSPLVRSYLRFNVQNLTGRIIRVTLRIYANSSSNVGYDIRLVTSTWSETSITYNNAPPFGSAVSASSPFTGGQWTTVDVTSIITGNGTYNLALTTASSTAISLASREAGTNAPQLIIETAP
jgi:hypothetical protein